MKTLHVTLLIGLSLPGCVIKTGNSSKNPNAGEFNGYADETGGEPAAGNASGSGSRKVARTSSATSTRSASASTLAKALAAKRPQVNGTKEKSEKSERNEVTGKDFKVAYDGVVPSSAHKGALIEVFGSGLDQKELTVAIGGTAQEVVAQSEDRAVVRVTGGSGKLQLGPTPAKGKSFKPVVESGSDFEVSGAALGARTTVDNGLVANVYAVDSGASELPTFEPGKEIGTFAVDMLNLNEDTLEAEVAGKNEWFGMHFRGSLNVTAAGDYTFCINSDDGAQFYLDSNLILDNDGAHDSAKEVCESFAVEPGEYMLDLLKYQGSKGPFVLELTWQKDGGKKAAIPTKFLYPPSDVADMAR